MSEREREETLKGKCINCKCDLNTEQGYIHSLFCSGQCKDAHIRRISKKK